MSCNNRSFSDLVLYAEGESERVKMLRTLSAKLRSLCYELDDTLLQAGQGISHLSSVNLACHCDALEDDMKEKLPQIYGIIDDLVAVTLAPSKGSPNASIEELERERLLTFLGPVCGISASVIDGIILVRTPRLPPYGNRKGSRNSRFGATYGRSYCEAVGIAMRELAKTLPREFLTSFGEKTVSVYHVYEVGTGIMSDADNHDIKTIIDAIVGCLPGGDCGTSFSCFFTNFIAPHGTEGTFFVVTPGRHTVPSDADFAEILEQFSSAKEKK